MADDLRKFIDKMGVFYEGLGIPYIGGRILGLMLISENPVSTDEIRSLLKVSRSSISNNMTMLTKIGCAELVRVPGDRKEYYVLANDPGEQSLYVKLASYGPLTELVEEGVLQLKKMNAPANKLENFISWIKLERKFMEQMLKEWKTVKKKKR